MPRPTSPIDDAGPLKGKIPPTLISVAVTPGVSAAKADVASAKPSAQPNASALNIGLSSICLSQGRFVQRRGFLVGGVDGVHDGREVTVLFLNLSSDPLAWTERVGSSRTHQAPF